MISSIDDRSAANQTKILTLLELSFNWERQMINRINKENKWYGIKR